MATFFVDEINISRYGIAKIEVNAETKQEAMKKIKIGSFYVDDFNEIEDHVESSDMPDLDDLLEQE